jgi:hypothetical protein
VYRYISCPYEVMRYEFAFQQLVQKKGNTRQLKGELVYNLFMSSSFIGVGSSLLFRLGWDVVPWSQSPTKGTEHHDTELLQCHFVYHKSHMKYIIYYYLIELKNGGVYPVTVVLQEDTTHKSTHVTQNNTHTRTKHSTQSYTNNKWHFIMGQCILLRV